MILSKSLGGLISPFMNSKTKDIEIESGYEKQERLRKEEEKRKKELEDIRIAKEKMLIQEEEAKQKLAEKNGKAIIGKDGKPLSPTAAAKINAKKLKRAKRKLKRREEFDDTDSENNSSAGSSSGSGSSGSDDGRADSTGPSRSQTPVPVSSHVPGSRSSTPVPFAATDSTGPTTSGTNPRSIYSEHPVTPISSLHSNKPHHHHNHHHKKKVVKIPDPEFLGCLILVPSEYMKKRDFTTYTLTDRPLKKTHNIGRISSTGTDVPVKDQSGTGAAADVGDITVPINTTVSRTDSINLPHTTYSTLLPVTYPVITISFSVETGTCACVYSAVSCCCGRLS